MNEEEIIKVVKRNGQALNLFTREQITKNILIATVKYTPNMLRYMNPCSELMDEEFYIIAMEAGACLYWVPNENRTGKVLEAAFRRDWFQVIHVDHQYMTDDLWAIVDQQRALDKQYNGPDPRSLCRKRELESLTLN